MAYNRGMDRQTALLELATAHAVALRLHDAGAPDDSVAQALGIPVESVAGLLRVAEAKLTALLGPADPEPAPPR
jgi:DNA-directed RNA polymerase specialized sigma24 family protein